MHFIVTVEALNNAWTYLQKMPIRPFSPEGNLVRAEGNIVTITIADTDMTVRIQIPDVTIKEEGVLSFSLKSVMSSFKQCNKTSEIEFKTTPSESNPNVQMLSVSGENYNVTIPGETESYTRMMDEMEDSTLQSITLPSLYLKQGLDHSIFAAVPSSGRASRPIFQSVLVELEPNEIHFVATDTFNFAYFKRSNIDNNVKASVCLPIKATEILNSLLRESSKEDDLTFRYGERFFGVKNNDFTFIARLREKDFPNYSFAIPKENLHEIAVSRLDIKAAIEFFGSYDSEKDLPIELYIKGDRMVISMAKTKTVALARKTIACVSDGDTEYRLAFQMSTLKNAFDHFSSQDVYLCVPDAEHVATTILKPTSEIDENVEFWQMATMVDLPPLSDN